MADNVGSAAPVNDVGNAGIPILRAWQDDRLLHGFLGRAGGISRGEFASLNLSYLVGDDRAAVEENWRRLRRLWADNIVEALLNQVHGTAVHVVDGSYDIGRRLAGDGMVSRTRGVMLGILSADCVPVLITNRPRTVAGTLHAGWRGTIANIAVRGVEAMGRLGAEPGDLEVALGPAIGECCFEVDRELADRFEHEVPGAGRHVRDGRPAKAYLDLKAIIGDQMERAGVNRESISSVGPCTRCASEQYFSRRGNGGRVGGLQLSYIGIR